jgi:hypothetical protein
MPTATIARLAPDIVIAPAQATFQDLCESLTAALLPVDVMSVPVQGAAQEPWLSSDVALRLHPESLARLPFALPSARGFVNGDKLTRHAQITHKRSMTSTYHAGS